MAFQIVLWTILIILLIIIISSLPLFFAVNLLGGKTSILRTFLVMVVVGFATVIIQAIFNYWGTLIAWILLLFIFMDVFDLGFIRAIIVWILWILFTILFIYIFSIIGFSFLAISLF